MDRTSSPPLPSHPSPASAPPSTPVPFEARHRVLVVDDDASIQRIARRLLGGHLVDVAESSADTLALLARGPAYDLILLDLGLGPESGIDVHRLIALHFPAQLARVVVMSGGAVDARSAAFLAALTTPRLDKPFDHGELLDIIERVAARPHRL